ncbi:hypothetical protein FB559_6017 [Actinoallomurus bryophytorum]|uniref:Uncharacterized protein n=1 Tax=Actinoallomurus bryophytorum TaxID=1490222 RepID=A0A543CT72_9ACTN|nr:hypothetical protein FB559_6017 [Actinoallomurus bryophytorum]
MRFTVHGPAQRPASPRGHRPPDGDVLGRIHVRMIGVPTGATTEDRLALTAFRSTVPTGIANLRSERGIDPLHPARRLVLQTCHQQAPSSSVNGPVQARLGTDVLARDLNGATRGTDHIADLQIFYTDAVETAGKVGGGLLNPIFAPIGLTRPQSTERGLDPLSPVRVPLRACQSPLQPQQTLRLTFPEARHHQQLASRQRRRDCHTTIHTDDLTGVRPADRWRDHGEGDMPASSPISVDTKRLDLIGDCAGPAEPHPADLGDSHCTTFAGYAAYVPLVSAFSDDAESLVPARLAPRWPTVGSGEQVGHSLGEVPKCLLLHRMGPGRQPCEFSSRLSQLARLFRITRRARSPWTPMRVLLYSEIPYKAGMCAVLQERLLLGRRGRKPKSHTNTPTATTDNQGRERCVLPGLKTGIVMPRIR